MAFITSLRIKNFFSIKDEVTIDFKASPYNIENNPERLFEFNGEYYNKVISLYGANASGKTTILKAIVTLADIVTNQSDKKFPPSFKNKFNKLDISSELSISFVLETKNGLEEFLYEVEFKSEKFENIGIKNEELFEVNKNNILIDRKNRVIKNVDSKVIEAVFNNLDSKKSLIQEFYKFEQKGFLKEIETFLDFLRNSSNITLYQSNLNVQKDSEEDIGKLLDDKSFSKQLEEFYLSFFNSIGLDICQVKAKYKETDGKSKEFEGIEVYHEFNQLEPLEFGLESDGTQMLMKVLLNIYIAKIMNTTLISDELDSSIHPSLVPIIINLLIKNDIQIIYSTHNIYNMQFLQTDEIFLIEKDSHHQTTIKAVKDNPDIKGYKNLLTLYENGYLGGLPNIKEILTKIL